MVVAKLTRVFAATTAVLLTAAAAAAQQFPSQPIRIIVPTPAGGGADIPGRVLGNHLTALGKTVVVENRTGAGGAIAASFVAKAPADGYTILVGLHATQAILPHLQALNYSPEKDPEPITIAVRSSNIMVVHPSVPANSVKEFIAYAKANPGKLSYASQGNGSSGHILGEQLKSVAGLQLNHVAYRGGAPATQDLVAGHVHLLFDLLTLSKPQIEAGKLRELMITTPEPNTNFPDVPTATQAGLPALEGGPWFGFFAPTGTPEAAIDYFYKEALVAFGSGPGKEAMAKQLLTPMPGTPSETRKFVAEEHKRWGDIIKSANIKLDSGPAK